MSRQFVDDMFLGIPSLVFGDTWQYIQDEEFQEGREIGRCASIVVGSALALDGAKNMGIGVAALLPTLGGGAVCTAASGGLCAILTGLGLTAEAALIGIGAAEVGWGLGVVRYAAHNPISGGSSSGSGEAKSVEDFFENPDLETLKDPSIAPGKGWEWRGKAVARLVPVSPRGETTLAPALEERLWELSATGFLTWNGGRFQLPEPVAVNQGPGLLSDLVMEDRE
jgi:hypothetical protein